MVDPALRSTAAAQRPEAMEAALVRSSEPIAWAPLLERLPGVPVDG